MTKSEKTKVITKIVNSKKYICVSIEEGEDKKEKICITTHNLYDYESLGLLKVAVLKIKGSILNNKK